MTESSSWWRTALVYGAYPTLVFGTMGLLFLGLEHRWVPTEWLGTSVIFVMGVLMLVLEVIVPDKDRRPNARTVFVDILHNVISSGGTSTVIRAGAFGLAVWVASASTDVLGFGLWPSEWPLVVQMLIALVLGELGSYWAHRLMHQSSTMWRIHALHHMPDHLYLLASARTHPFNAALVHGLQVGPIILLGAGPEVVVLCAGFTAITGLLQHANMEMRTEWLNWLIATPDLHRTHHSTKLEESNSNYGNNLMLWDIAFGTWQPGVTPAEYGVEGVTWPKSYLAQMAVPFIYPRISGEVSEAELSEAREGATTPSVT